MARIFILDSDPTGLACHEPGNREAGDFRAWMYGERYTKAIIVIPEIVDYEVRRALILAESWDGVRRLDDLYVKKHALYLPISTPKLPLVDQPMRKAAELWAKARRVHRPTATDKALDSDVILSAQAMGFCSDADDWQIITENIDHIARYVGNRARSRKAVVGAWMSSSRSIVP